MNTDQGKWHAHDAGPSLIQAAPYVEQFAGQFVVVKLGGELFAHATIADQIVPQIEVLYRCGLKPVLVHGGGKQIDLLCAERGIEIVKHGGRRVTSDAVLEAVIEVVAKQLNGQFCDLLRKRGIPVRGFEEGIADSVECRRRPPVEIDGEPVDFGAVGDVQQVHLDRLIQNDSERYTVPVLPCLGKTSRGKLVNINADSVAARVAVALKAQKLIMLSQAPGVMRDPNDAGPVATLSVAEARELIADGRAKAGMKAKLEEAFNAIGGGTPQVHIISGVEPDTLLHEIFTAEGCGTLITESPRR